MPNNESKDKMPWWQPGMILFARLSGWIGVPIIIALFVGKWLDQKYHSEPWLFLLSVGIAFIFSTYGIVRDSLREMKRIEKEEQDKNNQGKS
ncbi:MAG TPA: AtpZ/AtpI family protein [Patescibacteria group bacterium]